MVSMISSDVALVGDDDPERDDAVDVTIPEGMLVAGMVSNSPKGEWATRILPVLWLEKRGTCGRGGCSSGGSAVADEGAEAA